METEREDKKESAPKFRGVCGLALRAISFGQYQTKLYYRGKESHSSVLGGIVSIVSGIIFSLIALYILYQTIWTRDIINMSEQVKDNLSELNYTVQNYFD